MVDTSTLSFPEFKAYAETVRRDFLAAQTLDDIAQQRERYQREIQDEAKRRSQKV